MKVCPYCGKEIEEDERFCYYCDMDITKVLWEDDNKKINISDKSIMHEIKKLAKKLKKEVKELKEDNRKEKNSKQNKKSSKK